MSDEGVHGPRDLTGPVSVDALREAEALIDGALEPYATLLVAVHELQVSELFAEMERTMTWSNFLYVYRETLRSHFSGNQNQTPV